MGEIIGEWSVGKYTVLELSQDVYGKSPVPC